MEPEVYKKIFKVRFKGGMIDLNGIIVKLIDITEDDYQTPPYTLNFDMVNPMNLSYTRLALMALLEDKVDSLNDALGTPYYSVVNINNTQKIYLGEDLGEEYRRILRGIKQLKTDSYNDDDTEDVYTIINIEHKGIEVGINELYNSIEIINKVKFLDAYEVNSRTNELVNPLTFDDAESIYSYYVNDVIDDPNYNEIFNHNTPQFVHPDFMYSLVITEFEQ